MAIELTYWLSTALLSFLYLSSAVLYVAKPRFVRQAQQELGYSATHLVPFLIAIKVLAPAVILWRFSIALSDLAYAGMLYHLLLSGMAHIGAGKPKSAAPAAIGMLLLVASFATQNAAREIPSPYGLPQAAPAVMGGAH